MGMLSLNDLAVEGTQNTTNPKCIHIIYRH